jgi:hypothetical protein
MRGMAAVLEMEAQRCSQLAADFMGLFYRIDPAEEAPDEADLLQRLSAFISQCETGEEQ